MLRAMDSAVAGLRAHQNKLDVIGHNIANVNTAGYKTMSYNFKEAMYQTSTVSTSGSGSSGGSGGVNAAQYGYGTMMGSISVDMTASTPTQSSGLTAVIDGEGFFITGSTATELDIGTEADEVTDAMKGTNFQYTRVGQFMIDSEGYLVDSNSGNFVYGFQMNGNAFDTIDSDSFDTETLVPIRVCDVDGEFGSDDVAVATTVTIDSEGKITIGIKVTEPQTSYSKACPTLASSNPNADLFNEDTVSYEVNGEKQEIKVYKLNTSSTGYDSSKLVSDTEVKVGGDGLSAYKYTDGTTEYKVVENNGEYYAVKSWNTSNTNPFTGEDVEKLSSSTDVETTKEAVIGKVAIATFQNQEGLTKSGSSYYTASKTDNTGLCSVSAPGSGGSASLITGYIEASNVDLAKEFSDLITTQRGFQANSKIITVSDQILEELVNMKR